MIRLLKKIKQDKFYKHSLMLFSAMMFLNIAGYLFHFIIGRKLGPEDYGVFGVVLSIDTILIAPIFAIQTIISNFITKLKVNKSYGKISYLLKISYKKLTILGLIFLVIFLSLIKSIANFLNIPTVVPLMIVGVTVVFSLLLPINRGALQGLQDFKNLSLNLIYEGLTKFIIGVGLVFLGFKYNGAITGITLSLVIPFFLIFPAIKKILKKPKVKFDPKPIYKYTLPVFTAIFILGSFYTLDIILVKHFFDPIIAGYYIALAIFGKIIFFGSIAITQVMFPKVTEYHKLKTSSRKLLYKSLSIVFLFSLAVTLFYFIFPKFTVVTLYGKEFLPIAPLLGFFGIFMSIVSMLYVFVFYNLAIDRFRFVWFLIFGSILEIILINLFHNTLLTVVKILIFISIFIFIIMFLYTFLISKKLSNLKNQNA